MVKDLCRWGLAGLDWKEQSEKRVAIKEGVKDKKVKEKNKRRVRGEKGTVESTMDWGEFTVKKGDKRREKERGEKRSSGELVGGSENKQRKNIIQK